MPCLCMHVQGCPQACSIISSYFKIGFWLRKTYVKTRKGGTCTWTMLRTLRMSPKSDHPKYIKRSTAKCATIMNALWDERCLIFLGVHLSCRPFWSSYRRDPSTTTTTWINWVTLHSRHAQPIPTWKSRQTDGWKDASRRIITLLEGW